VFDQCQEALFILIDSLNTDGIDTEAIVGHILSLLRAQGEDILQHLDPPVGLRHWLESHGLSLVPTGQAPAPWQWDEREEEPEPDNTITSAINLGDRVRYQTAAMGPRGQSKLGEGTVIAMRQDSIDLVITVQVSLVERVHLIPSQGDVIEVIPPRP
jgi:hypothetical protein